MNEICEKLYRIGIVPVIAIDDAKDAKPLAKALIDGGLPAVLPGCSGSSISRATHRYLRAKR